MKPEITLNNLTFDKVPQPKVPLDRYDIDVTVMHGDADKFEHVLMHYSNRADFLKDLNLLNNAPQNSSEGGLDYERWVRDNNFDFPYDVVYTNNTTSLCSFRAYYWNGVGEKFEITFR